MFRKAGFEVDLISETGTCQPDWVSQQKDWLNDKDRAVWEDHLSEFRSKLDKLLKPSDIDPEKVNDPQARFKLVQMSKLFTWAVLSQQCRSSPYPRSRWTSGAYETFLAVAVAASSRALVIVVN